MQNIASPLQRDTAFDAASQHLTPTATGLEQGTDSPTQRSAASRRIEGPDLSGAIERVLAWHRSRQNH